MSSNTRNYTDARTWYIHDCDTGNDLTGFYTCFEANRKCEELNEQCGHDRYECYNAGLESNE